MDTAAEFIQAHLAEAMPLGEEMLLSDVTARLAGLSHMVTRNEVYRSLRRAKQACAVVYALRLGGYSVWMRVGDIELPQQDRQREGVRKIRKPTFVPGASSTVGHYVDVSVPVEPWEVEQ